jgi:site-specific recombinase XerD
MEALHMVYQLINDCIDTERQRGLRPETIKELKRYLHEFADYCQPKLQRLEDMTSDFLREYVMFRGNDRDKSVKKAVVWCLRKFGAYLVLRGKLVKNPAKPLRHPKISPRKELPQYLKKDELQALLIHTSNHACQRDFTILALIASTGMRPSAIAALQKNHFSSSGQYIIETLKGGGLKKTALNESVCMLLQAYLDSRTDKSLAMFLTDRSKPMYIGLVQKLVKDAGKIAGLKTSLTCNILRHTFAVHAADRHGKTITKTLMGHRKLSTTAVYTHLSASHFRVLMNSHPLNNGGA